MASRWWPIIILLLLSACASRPPARVDEINTRPAQSKSTTQRQSRIIPDYYRVKQGDSLYSIGFRYEMDYKKLAAINNINPPYTIYPNQRIRLKPTKTRTAQTRQRKTTTKTSTITTGKKVAQQPLNKTKKPTTDSTQQSPPKPTRKKPPQQKPDITVSKQPPKTKPVVNLPKSGDLNWLWPTKGKIRTTFLGSNPARKGISIRGQEGQDVKAAEAGIVVYSGDGLLGYGELIIIKHNDQFLSAYGHNKKRHVKEGQQVKRGDVIAQLGSSGTNVNNLHFEIRKNGQPVNPLDYVKP